MTAVTPGAVAAGTMTAIVQDEYGTAPEAVLRLAGITRPAIAADEILVRVRAASVDRGTWHLMAGLPYPMRLAGFGLRRPKAPNPGPRPHRRTQAQAERPPGRHRPPQYQATGPDGKRLHTVAEIAAAAGVHRTTVYDYLNKEH